MPSELRVDKISTTASPYDPVFSTTGGALSHRNMMINGAMLIDQRNAGALATNIGATDNDYRTLDRWRNIWTGGETARNSLQQVAVTDLAGFSKALKVDCVTAEGGTQDADESFKMAYRFEGQDLQGMEKGFSTAKPVTVSLWVKGTASKTYMLELHQAKSTARHATQQFSVTASWVKHTYTFPGDTTNTIDCDNAEGLELNIWLFAGSNYTSGSYTSKTWANVTAANRAVGISDSGKGLMNSTSDEVYFTGFQMELGSVATPFEHKSYGEELARCQRYFEARTIKTNTDQLIAYGYNYSASEIDVEVAFVVPMRANPTIVQTSGTNYFHGWDGGAATSFDNFTNVQHHAPKDNNVQRVNMYKSSLSGLTVGRVNKMTLTSTGANAGIFGFEAEL